ncbi:MAG TPA: ATP synthase F1 subunit delta [Puia sp.]
MPNPRLATRYAKSLIDLSIEQGQLDTVYKDVLYLKSIFENSQELVNFLNNPVITSDQKLAVVKALDSEKTGELTKSFNRLLIRKGRESYLPEIAEAFIEQYKEYKGIHTVTLTTAIPASDEVKNAIINRIKRDGQMKEVELICIVQESIIGGFILEGKGRRIDASVAYDLTKVKNRFLTNEFIYRFR